MVPLRWSARGEERDSLEHGPPPEDAFLIRSRGGAGGVAPEGPNVLASDNPRPSTAPAERNVELNKLNCHNSEYISVIYSL